MTVPAAWRAHSSGQVGIVPGLGRPRVAPDPSRECTTVVQMHHDGAAPAGDRRPCDFAPRSASTAFVTSPRPDAPLPARYVVIGAAGQLGFDLVRTFDRAGELVALTRRELDVLDAGSVRAVLTDLRPTCVLNTTAYNRVDAAEDDRAG